MSKLRGSLAIWLFSGVAGLLVFIYFYNSAFPSASIDLKLSKKEAFKKAESFISAQGFDLKGFDKTIQFSCDDIAAVYLQKTQGIQKSNALIRKEAPVWFWHLRWFKELEKEGFYADIDPATGEVISFAHAILEDRQGADLTESAARLLAEKVVLSRGIDLREYELKEDVTEKQKHRTDYSFSWEKKNYKIAQATFRVGVDILGDTLGLFKIYLKVPETFSRDLGKEKSIGYALSMVSTLCMFLLIIGAIVVAVAQNNRSNINWRFGAIFGGIAAILSIVSSLNSIPLIWSSYPDTMSKTVFMVTSLGSICISALLSGLLVFVYGATGEPLLREFGKIKMPLFDAIRNRKFIASDVVPSVLVGYSLGFIFLGYVTVFYLLGEKFFNIWMPPRSAYSNILGTCVPFLFPLTAALMAAISEEFLFRLFSILFLKKHLKLMWLAVLIPSVVWALAHSTYPIFPVFMRGIELTVFGVVLGLVFLKYGLETVVIAHFVIDATLVGLPLLKSQNPYYVISGLMVILMALAPVPVAVAVRNKRE
jgi:membrane protease YdiL (CAAX protease family)